MCGSPNVSRIFRVSGCPGPKDLQPGLASSEHPEILSQGSFLDTARMHAALLYALQHQWQCVQLPQQNEPYKAGVKQLPWQKLVRKIARRNQGTCRWRAQDVIQTAEINFT
eukprot:scaffold236577_cov21-Tisochrysis_lutea.AAC.1